MSDPWRQLWSNISDASQLPKYNYVEEKTTLAGSFISAIFYGTPTHSFAYSYSLPSFGAF